MKKHEELSNPKSCLNRAADNEPLFVIRGKDPAAAAAIRSWMQRRIDLGLNTLSDDKMVSAAALAVEIEEYKP